MNFLLLPKCPLMVINHRPFKREFHFKTLLGSFSHLPGLLNAPQTVFRLLALIFRYLISVWYEQTPPSPAPHRSSFKIKLHVRLSVKYISLLLMTDIDLLMNVSAFVY